MKNWERFESKLARKTGGRRTPGSGNGNQKGDVRSKYLLIEAKETSKDYLTIQTAWLINLSQEAEKRKVTPVLAIEFGDGTTRYLSPNLDIDIREYVDISTARSFRLKLEDAIEGLALVTYSCDWVLVGPDTFEDLLNDV